MGEDLAVDDDADGGGGGGCGGDTLQDPPPAELERDRLRSPRARASPNSSARRRWRSETNSGLGSVAPGCAARQLDRGAHRLGVVGVRFEVAGASVAEDGIDEARRSGDVSSQFLGELRGAAKRPVLEHFRVAQADVHRRALPLATSTTAGTAVRGYGRTVRVTRRGCDVTRCGASVSGAGSWSDGRSRSTSIVVISIRKCRFQCVASTVRAVARR